MICFSPILVGLSLGLEFVGEGGGYFGWVLGGGRRRVWLCISLCVCVKEIRGWGFFVLGFARDAMVEARCRGDKGEILVITHFIIIT